MPGPAARSSAPFYIPPILLEGDEPAAPPPQTKRTAPASSGASETSTQGNLPEAYGSGRLVLTPRDPTCLCAHWDFSAGQLRAFNQRSAHQHLLLRVYREPRRDNPLSELHVHPESRHWFVHVDFPGSSYVVEAGFYDAAGQWHRIGISQPAATPPAAPPSLPETAPPRFEEFRFEQAERRGPPETTPAETRSLVSSREQLARRLTEPLPLPPIPPPAAPITQSPQPAPRAHAHPPPAQPTRQGRSIQAQRTPHPENWDGGQIEALARLIGFTLVRRNGGGSAEIMQLLEEAPARAVSSAALAELAQPGAPAPLEIISSPPGPELGGISSPAEAAPAEAKSFWFNLNAELVIYGATEPDAQVTIGGRPIRLRPDGTFSYRFSLPDGNYGLPIAATAVHGDQRRAELRFFRGTTYAGEVGAHPQDGKLRPPAVENIQD